MRQYDRYLPEQRSVDFIYFEAGGGHRSAALALQSVVGSLQYDWTVRLVNLQEVLDPLDVFRKLTRIRLEDIYNLALAKGWTLGSSYLLPWMQAVIRLYHGPQVKLLTKFWGDQPPDMVVSLVPNFNRALFESLQRAVPGTPFVTILTDFADYPPHFWMEKQDQYLVCGTARAVEQAKAVGFDEEHITATSGMILRPEFYNLPDVDRRKERERLGLDPELPTGLVLFGGEGSSVMLPIAKRLGNSSSNLQLIMICGRNKELLGRLQQLKTKNKFVLEGFTKEIPRYMSMADFFVGKPGPGSISEAVRLNLPVIVERNAWTLPQERYNAQWIAEQGVGMVLKNFRDVDEAVHKLLEDGTLTDMKARIGRIDNRAVFEIPPALARILEKRSHFQL